MTRRLGLIGRAVQTLDHRGLLERFGAGFVPVAATRGSRILAASPCT